MQWLLTAHVRRYHTYHESSGHVWQGRFKAFPIEQDDHLLTVLRYIEQNPVRGGLVVRAEECAGRVPTLETGNPRHPWMQDPFPVQRGGSTG